MMRRSFLREASLAAVVVVGGGFAGWRFFTPTKQALSLPLMLSGFCDEATLRDVGRRYLALFSDENSSAILRSRLAAGEGRDAIEGASEAAEQAEQAEQDFQAKEFLVIDGWIISRTEARQCALLALT